MTDKQAKNLTKEYWDRLLGENTSLKGVGWPNWPESYNLILYKKYLKGFEDVINYLQSKCNFDIKGEIRVLEIGPGSGFYTRCFSQIPIKDYVGADISEISISKLRQQYPGFTFVQKNISDTDEFVRENINTFDLICVVDVLLHITDDSKFRFALNNISSMLKRGGYIIIGDAISIFNKRNHAEGTRYTTDVSRHITYLQDLFSVSGIELKEIFHRHNFLLNKNFDFKYSIFNKLNKPFFYMLNGGLTVFKNSNLIGKLVGYPLSMIDMIITPLQKYSKNSKFLLFRKNP